jgi:hypothetical protein
LKDCPEHGEPEETDGEVSDDGTDTSLISGIKDISSFLGGKTSTMERLSSSREGEKLSQFSSTDPFTSIVFDSPSTETCSAIVTVFIKDRFP